MDKFFIQNAFKTLDEIEEEIKSNKKNLTEDLQKEDLEDLDFDELSDKYVGKIFNFGDKAVEIITLINYYNNFELSTWKVVTPDGDLFNVKGKDLTASKNKSLYEKLPQDLAKAYHLAATTFPAMKRQNGEPIYDAEVRKIRYFPTAMKRGRVNIDFENSNYTDITAEDRKKIIRDYKDCKYKLRLLFNISFTGKNKAVIMWDKNDNFITSPRELPTYVLPESPLYHISSLAAHSFSNLVKAADKIYVTDESDHIIDRSENIEDDPELKDIRSMKNKLDSMIGYSSFSSPEHKIGTDVDIYTTSKELAKHPEDTGDHSTRYNGSSKNDLHYYQDRYNHAKNDPSFNPDAINYLLKKLKAAQYRYNSSKRKDNIRNYFINYNVLKFKLLKLIRKQIIKKYEEAEQAQSGLFDSDRYIAALKKKEILNKKIKALQDELSSLVKELTDLNPDLSDEAKQEYIEKRDAYIDELFDDATQYLDELDKYIDKINQFKNNHAIKESLDTCVLRIYTRSMDGFEDFIDDFNTEEDAKLTYNDLVASNTYEQVCLVAVCGDKIEILMDSQDSLVDDLNEEITDKRSIGEIVDDKLQEENLEKDKLTESKSFNLKDENDIIDANVYKKVGDDSQDELVVVDPSVESKDDDFQPHAGDAILQCKSCKTSIFKKTYELIKDENSDVYNIDMDCPHCGAKTGFIYIGQVATKSAGADVEDEKPAEEVKDEDEAEINSEESKADEESNSLSEVDDDYVDLDTLDDIKEESFEKLVNPYLTKLYENIDHFKTTNIEQTGRDSIKIEGKLVSKNGKEKLVEFLFKTKENKANSIVFEGYNKILTEQKDAFKLKGNVKDKELIFESFEYNYNKEVDGNEILIEGIEK